MDGIREQMGRYIRTEIDEIVEAEMNVTQQRIADKVRGRVGAIAAKVLENFSYERMGQDLVISCAVRLP